MLRSTVASMSRSSGLGSDKFVIVNGLHEFQELVFPDASGAACGRHEDAVRGDQDRAFLASDDPKTLGLQFAEEGVRSGNEGDLEPGPFEARRRPLRSLSRDVGKAFHLRGTPLGAGGLDVFAMIRLVAPRQVFEAREILSAIQDPKRDRIDFGNGDVEMAAPLFDVAHDKTRAIRTEPELGIDHSHKRTQCCGRHFLFRRYGKMADAIAAAFNLGECLSIIESTPVARQNLDPLVFLRLVKQMASKVLDTTVPTDAGRLDDHDSNSRNRLRSASTPDRVSESSASCPESIPPFARRVS